jgi:PAS domain S-box-containing protein
VSSGIDPPLLTEQLKAALDRIRDLEARLEESEDTLDAIRSGDFDAVVVQGPDSTRQVYTLDGADRPYRVLIEQIQEGALTLSQDGTVLYCNPRLADMLGIPPERLMGHQLLDFVSDEDRASLAYMLRSASDDVARGELNFRASDGDAVPMYLSLSPLEREGSTRLLCGVLTDLREQKLHLSELAEANARLRVEGLEREKIEEALRQAQKMEAVGQLTGGLAHDFNNLLTGISGSLDLLQKRVAQGRINDLDRYLIAAQGASKRAAALTHRLLAFSRRQTLDPKPTDVHKLVLGMTDLIRRTVGPEITVETVDMVGLWPALVDPPQLENALLNLCINARDAMPDGGRITIETANRWMDDRTARARDVEPGQYLSLCVSDTGTGMTPDIVARAFDPFFTTKPIGQGTGLGLSMIYGFARQSGGQARIYSEVGQGTMVCIYLPRHYGEGGEAVAEADRNDEAPRAVEGETVLVVDDEPTVRMLVIDVLGDLGYQALEAEDGASGLKILQSRARVDLLITDVGLPNGMNGRQVADAARVLRPGLKVLFITGYAENAVVGNGHLDPGMAVLTKPFAMDDLAAKIRALIES